MYGDHGDVVITEESGTLTHTKTGLRRLNCERAWKNLQRKDMKCFIFRVAGIYGPNRSALHTILGDINALSHVNEAGCDVPASRIHIDDIVSALCAAMMKDVKVEPVSKCCIINLADDLPTCRRVVFEYAASLLQLPSLRALRAHAARNVRATESRSGKRRRKERVCKRISNDKMKQMLRIQLKYPTFRHGLIAIVASLIQ